MSSFDPNNTTPSPNEAEKNDAPTTDAPNAEVAKTDAPKTEGAEVAKPRRPRGFAAMDRKRVSEIASKGGKAAHAAGTAHQFTSEEARAAGHKGGVAPHVRRGRGPRAPKPVPQSAPESSDAPKST